MNRETETWQNRTQGVVVVWKFDQHGNLKDEVIRAGAKFQISSDERARNMEDAATDELDNFKNGNLVPVKLLDGTEDVKEIASNPNLIGEDDMRSLFSAHWKTFEQKVQEISSLGTLSRLLEIAGEGEATVRQVGVLESRIKELSPQVAEVTTEGPAVSSTAAFGASGRPI